METQGSKKRNLKKQLGIVIGIVLWTLNVLVLLFRTKVILNVYGSEMNGVVQTSNQIFAYFVLFEGGLSAAYMYKMYAPMASKDYSRIGALFAGLRISLRKISVNMLLALVPVSICGAFFIAQIDVGKVYTALIILMTGLRFVAPYYFSLAYKTLLNIYDYKYVIDIMDTSTSITIAFVEIGLAYLGFNIVVILCSGIVMNVMISILYKITVRKVCSKECLEKTEPNFGADEMTRDILVHQVGSLANNNIDTILLSMMNVSMVNMYIGYMQVTSSAVALVNRISDNFRALIGIKMVGSQNRSFYYFQRVLSYHMLAVMIILPIYISGIEKFILLWLGRDFISNNYTIIAVAIFITMRMTNNAIYIIADGNGLYKETKKYAVIEAVANLLLSIPFGLKWGVTGVIVATDIAYGLVIIPSYTGKIYKKVFKQTNFFLFNYFIMAGAVTISVKVYKMLFGQLNQESWIGLIMSSAIQGVIALPIGILLLCPIKAKYWKRQVEESS